MRHLLLLLTFIFSFSFANAQDSDIDKDKKLNFGIRHGYSDFTRITTVNLGNQTYTESDNQLTLYLGFFLEKRISEKFKLRLEANYSPAAKLEVPLLVSYNISKKFSFYAGVQLDYSENGGTSNEAFRNRELGSSLVFGVEYKINNHWFLEARYTHGLSNQYRLFNGFDATPVFGKKRSISLGVGYRF